jgi:hypothetical protein
MTERIANLLGGSKQKGCVGHKSRLQPFSSGRSRPYMEIRLMPKTSKKSSVHTDFEAEAEAEAVVEWLRTSYWGGELSPGQIKKVELTLNGWSWGVPEAEEQFERSMAALTIYSRRTGNSYPPRAHVERGVRLGEFCFQVREAEADQRCALIPHPKVSDTIC